MSKELHILSNSNMLEFVLAAFGLKLSDIQQHIHTRISHEHKLNFAILLWETDHRQWVTELGEGKYCFSVLLSDFLSTAVIVALILLDLD